MNTGFCELQFGDEEQSGDGSRVVVTVVQQYRRGFEPNCTKSRTETVQSHQRNSTAWNNQPFVHTYGASAGIGIDAGSLGKEQLRSRRFW